jgi:molybdopterin molybdotransferase
MISVMEALNLVISRTPHVEPVPESLDNLPGLVLADEVVAHADIPPAPKAVMDGYAVRASEARGGAKLKVSSRLCAGERSVCEIPAGGCVRIMTGAEVPAGLDAVVPLENTDRGEDEVLINAAPKPGEYVLAAGGVVKAGDVMFHAGHRVRVQDVPAIAAMNFSHLGAFALPSVGVVSSGDELVDVGAPPGSSAVPDVNRHTLTALLRRDGLDCDFLGIASDTREAARSFLKRGLSKRILIFSGGVSAGDKDLLPGVFEEEGVETVFAGVSMKPGKPVFFGVKDATAVFGLPGNPASVFVAYLLFVRTAIGRIAGRPDFAVRFERARLVGRSMQGGDRTAFHPARAFHSGAELCVSALSSAGSVDVAALARSNALVVLQPSPARVSDGDEVEIIPINPDFS